MDDTTIRRLNRLNQDFYSATADRFDLLRRGSWPGWMPLLPYLPQKVRVLDVGCGNGRFGLFLARQRDVTYHGIDNNPRLLERAQTILAGIEATLELRDVVENPPDSGVYDLVALFGMLHHVPGSQRRLDLMRRLASLVAPGGLLAFACWRFYEYERFREKFVPWPDNLDREAGDYLLDWRRGENAIRYCHYIDDAEHVGLIAASGLSQIETYRADGETHDANRYSILRAPTSPPSPLSEFREGEQ